MINYLYNLKFCALFLLGIYIIWQKKYSFPEEDESIVRNIWEDKARIALNQQLTRARKNAMSKENTTNILDCLDKGPAQINNDDCNQMIKDVWSTLEFERRFESARRNRLSQTDGKISTHSGETVSFASYRANMVRIFFYARIFFLCLR